MELEVYWLALAENKLEDIYVYYSIKASKQIAKNLINGIVDTTIGIKKQPEIGQIEIRLKHKNKNLDILFLKIIK